MNLSLTLTADQSAKLTSLKDAGARMLPPLMRAWHAGSLEVLGRAVKGRFTGKGPFPVSQNRLGVVTNRLRKSMRATEPHLDAASGVIDVGMGSNVSYFRGHEFGFKGQVQVKGHTRKSVADNSRTSRGKLTKGSINNLKNAKLVRGQSNYSYVKPHSHRVNIPARRPLGTELAAVTTRLTFRQKINQVIRRVLGFN